MFKLSHHGETAFYIACYYSDIETVKLLLNDKRVDINKAGKGKWSPLLMACCSRKVKL